MKVELSGFKGIEEALVELERLSGRTTSGRGVLRRAGIEATAPLRDRMAQLAPFDPQDRDGDGNHLRDTMRTQQAKARLARKLGTDRKSGVVLLTGPAPVGRRARGNAGWQERGTVKQAANPYVRPAADAEGATVIENLTVELTKQVEKVKKRMVRRAAKRAS